MTGGGSDVALRLSGVALGYGAVDTSRTGWVGAAEFTGQITQGGVTSSFLTYCTDIYHCFDWNTRYTYSPVVTAARLCRASPHDVVLFERTPLVRVVSGPTSLRLAGLALAGVAAVRCKKKGPGDRVTITRP